MSEVVINITHPTLFEKTFDARVQKPSARRWC